MKTCETILKETGAMLEGHFLLSSGLHSDRYFQCARLLQYPDRAAKALASLVAQLKNDIDSGKLKIDVVVGPAMGGIVVAYELARQLGLPAMFTERSESGLMSLRRGFEIRRRQQILIAEDVVTTGKSSLETAKVLEAQGASIAALACIVDRRAESVPTAWPLYAAYKTEVQNWESDNCPLCKEGSTAVKPGSRKIFN